MLGPEPPRAHLVSIGGDDDPFVLRSLEPIEDRQLFVVDLHDVAARRRSRGGHEAWVHPASQTSRAPSGDGGALERRRTTEEVLEERWVLERAVDEEPVHTGRRYRWRYRWTRRTKTGVSAIRASARRIAVRTRG